MKQLYLILSSLLLMAILIPFHKSMAVHPDAPLFTHFVYMAGHANILHWLINAWALFVLHNLFTMARWVMAYICAVVLSFCYYPELPVLGASVFVSFFSGFMLIWLRKRHRLIFWQLLALIRIGFFIPHIAAMYHLAMLLAGLLFNRIEWLIADYKYFTSR